MSVEDAIDQFVDKLWLERGLAANTQDAYQSDLKHAQAFLHTQHTDLLQATTDHLLGYLTSLTVQARQSRTSARRLSCLRQFYQLAVREGWLAEDPSALLAAPKRARHLPDALNESEMEALLAAPDLHKPEGLRDRCMLELLYATGLRVTELVELTASQISLSQGLVQIQGKGGKERLVPMGDPALDWITRFQREGRQDLLKGKQCNAFFPTRRGAGMTRRTFITTYPAPCVCDSSGQSWRRSACRAVIARTQCPLNHTDLHACGPGAFAAFVSSTPPEGINTPEHP